MKQESIKSKIDVFVCNHKRDSDEDCFGKGAKELTDNLKKWAKENHKGEIKIFRSGCLGKCSEGIAIACFPEKKFFLEVNTNNEEDIKKAISR
ncbi:MAG: (2Fe-2S) ferredoxin domain-containing protein [Bacteriovoracaceae bacterium]